MSDTKGGASKTPRPPARATACPPRDIETDQLTLPLGASKTGATRDQGPAQPAPPQGRSLIPDWYAQPTPTAAELEAATQEANAALEAYQASLAAFLAGHPSPSRGAEWQEYARHSQAQKRAIATAVHRLNLARERRRRLLCIEGGLSAATQARIDAGDTYPADPLPPELPLPEPPASGSS